MSASAQAYILIILVLLLLLVLAFMGSRFLMRRALKRVIQIFREFKARDETSAMTQEAMGLKPRGIFEVRGLRDYKPMALQLLMRYNVVRMTEDGRLYLSEETLTQTNLEPDSLKRSQF
jgi:hypothetical protein